MLLVAHKNSLRALMRLLDAVRDEDVPRTSIRTGRPLLFKLDRELSVLSRRYLDDRVDAVAISPAAAAAASAQDA